MDNTFKLMKPVQWHEGLLLYPQHFQQMRREFQQLSLCYLSMGVPYYWGVRSYSLDEAAFASGLLRLKSLLATMPDGSIVEREEHDAQIIELDLRDYEEELEKGPLTINLAVMRHQKDAATVQGDFPRYDSVEGPPLPDENTGEGAVPIPRLALKAFLVPGETVPVRYSSFPLLKIKAQDGGFAIEDFIPPATDIRKISPVGRLCAEVVKAIRKNAAILSEKLQAPVTEGTASLLDQYKRNYDIMVSRLLSLETLVNTQALHPFNLYKELSVIAGVFCAFSRGHMPPIFEPYNHNDLKSTFEPLLNFIDQMLDFVKGASSSFPFEWEGRLFKNDLKPEWIQGSSVILGVTLSADGSPRSLKDWVNKAVIASASMAEKAQDNRVLGAPREFVEQVPELGLTMTRGKFLVRVDAQSEYIVPGEPLCIFNRAATQSAKPTEVVLYTSAE